MHGLINLGFGECHTEVILTQLSKFEAQLRNFVNKHS